MEEKQKRIEFLEKKVQTKDEVLAESMAEHVVLKKSWGTLTGNWVLHDVRGQVVDFVRRWSASRDPARLPAIPSATPASARWMRRAGRESRQRSVQPG